MKKEKISAKCELHSENNEARINENEARINLKMQSDFTRERKMIDGRSQIMNVGYLENTPENINKKIQKTSKFPFAFNVRASGKEHEKLKELSSFTGTLSRLVIETTLSKPLLSAEDVAQEHADREEMIFQLRRIGINLNQITSTLHAVHRGVQASVTETQLEETAAEIKAVISALKKKL